MHIEIIFVWIVCISVLIYVVIKWWFKDYNKDGDYIIQSDDRLLDDLSMMGVNDE